MIYLLIGSFHTHSHIFPGNTQPEFPQPISITSPLMVWLLLVLGGNMVKLGSDPFALPLAVHAAVIRQLMLERGATLLYLCWSCLQILFLRLHLVWADCPSSLCASLQPGILWLGLQGSVLAPWDLRLQGLGAMGKHDDHWLFSVEEKFRFPEGTHLFLCYCQWDFQLLI